MKLPWRRPRGHDINCQHAVELVTDYLDGALTRKERRVFEAHLAECPYCTEHLKQVRLAISATGRVSMEDLDPLAREDLMALYRRWRADQR